MTEPKFTPATWFIHEREDTMYDIVTEFYTDEANEEEQEIICEQVCLPNAHLIAAAPDLYKELEKCAKLLRSYERHHLQKGDREKAERNAKYAERCEKLLAKARGET